MKECMRFSKPNCFLLTAAFLLAAFSAFGQTGRPDFNRPHAYDVQNYTIRASFDRVNKKVFGDTTVSLKPLKADFRSVDLDAVDITFQSVKLDPAGIDLQYKIVPGKIVITLDKAYTSDDLIAIRMKYSATPVKGVYFRDPESGQGIAEHSAQVWSQGEAEEARYWIPSFDFPSDKATSEEYLTAEKGETVVGNGELLGKDENTDGTETWHYKMPVPHSTYLISFVIGKYSRIDDKYNDIPLGFYVYPGKEATARKAFGDTKKMIGAFEELTGVKFPYNKYDQTLVAKFQFGGMENITATTMADGEIFFADFDFGKSVVIDLVSHELSHSWFGDLVTCKNWAELWLNEGFATYMEAAYREKAFGHDDYVRKIRSDAAEFLVDDTINKHRYGLFNLQARDVDSLFDNASVTYHKGGVVLYMLREQVGTENFWKAINTYLNRYKFGNVESTDLRKVMEETSGQDLGWFFDQWVYGVGAPRLSVRQVYNPRAKTLRLTFTQVQKPDPNAPAVYRMPMDVSYKVNGKTETKPISITKRIDTFTIPAAAKPTDVVIDPNDKVMLKTVKLLPMVSLQ